MNNNEHFTTDELDRINKADDLKVSPFRDDGHTFGTPTWIWSVVVDGNLYARAYHGLQSRWYMAAVKQKAGRIHAAGMIRDVYFEEVQGTIQEKIDHAYRVKYKRSPYLPAMITGSAVEATVRIFPR